MKNSKPKTHNERLLEHFEGNAAPLDQRGVASVLNSTWRVAGNVISELARGNSLWSGVVTRNPLTLHSITRKDVWRVKLREQIEAALMTTANPVDLQIAKSLNCSAKYVGRIRMALIAEGHEQLKRKPKNTSSKIKDKRVAIREALLKERVKTNVRIAAIVGCSANLVSVVRKEMIAEGHEQLKRVNVEYLNRNENDNGWIVPTMRHKDDEPYLAQARQFREIWPMRWAQ